MEENLLGYFAGIVDGEGSIGISKSIRKLEYNKRGYVYNPFFLIANTHLPMLEYLQKHFKGKIVYLDERTLCYHLTFNGEIMKDLLPELIPYLLIKRRQAEIVLEFLKKKEEIGSRPPSDDLYKYYEWCYQECKRLKLIRYNYNIVRIPFGVLKCKQCGKDFMANSGSQRYCCKYCKQNARWIISNETQRIRKSRQKQILVGETKNILI